LLALWLFATIEGVASARQVARLCGEHIAYRWLCGGVGMNAKTLADFGVGHGAALEDLLIDSFAGLVMAGVAVWIAWCKMAFVCEHRRSGLVPPAFDLRRLPGRSGASGTPSSRRSYARSLRGEPARGSEIMACGSFSCAVSARSNRSRSCMA
jgi:transposase-like protein DUF772